MHNKDVVTSDEYGNLFVWDSAKAFGHVSTHLISFENAVRVFGDPTAVLEKDALLRVNSVGTPSA